MKIYIGLILCACLIVGCKTPEGNGPSEISSVQTRLSPHEKLTSGFTGKPWSLLYTSDQQGRICPKELWLNWEELEGERVLALQEKSDSGNFFPAFDGAPFKAFAGKQCHENIPFDSYTALQVCHEGWVKGSSLFHRVSSAKKKGMFAWKINTGITVGTQSATQTLDLISKSLIKYRYEITGHEDLGFYCEYIQN